MCNSSIFDPFQGGTPLDLYFLSEIRLWMFGILGGPILIFIAFADALLLHYLILFSFPKSDARRPAFLEDLCRHLSHLRMTCLPFASQNSAFPTSRAGRLAFSEDLYRFLSHLRMPFFNFTSYYSLIAVSYRSVHVIRVSTRKILALRGLCTYRVFDPRFVSSGRCLRT